MNPLLYDRIDLRRRGIKLSASSLVRLEKSGKFPVRIRISTNSVAWLATEIDTHVENLAAARGVVA